MLNGDISNVGTDIVVMIDGKGFLYIDATGWWSRFLRWIGFKLKSVKLLMSTIYVDAMAVRIAKSLFDNPQVYFKILVYNTEDTFVVNNCIVSVLDFLENSVQRIYTEQQFKDCSMYSDLLFSNQYMGVNGTAKRITFMNVEQVKTNIANEIGFGRK